MTSPSDVDLGSPPASAAAPQENSAAGAGDAEHGAGRVRGWLRRARWLARLGAAAFVVALPLALIGTNVRILFTSRPLYTFALDTYDVPTVTGIPRQELDRAMTEIRDYFANDQRLLRITVTDSSGRTNPLFTPREVIHMRDVKGLVGGIVRVQQVAIIVVAAYVVLRLAIEGRRGWRGLARLTRASMLGTLAVAVAFGISAFVGFDDLFTRFHEISFSNDLWQLDPSRDHLVQMFPQDFWLVSTVLLAGMTVVEVLTLLALSWGFLRRTEKDSAT